MPPTNRRKFLHIAAAGLASVPASRAIAANAGKKQSAKNKKYDVIVIGGGFAGVTAARDSSMAGLKTMLLEAKGVLGGRTFTSEFDGHLIEYGGTWIHWTQPHVWSEVMRYNLEIAETSGANPDNLFYRENNKVVNSTVEDVWPDFDTALMKSCARAAELYPRPYDAFLNAKEWKKLDHLSLAEGINQAGLTDRQQMFAGGLLGATCNNSPEVGGYTDILRLFSLSGNTSSLYLDSVGRYKIKKGTRALINAMMDDAELDLNLGKPVAQIEQTKNGVRVTGENGESWSADQCIIALPLNVLKNIDFKPAISQLKLDASREEHSGKGTKFYVQVKGDLGNIMGLDGGNAPIQALFTYARNSSHTLLVGFGAGKKYMDPANKSDLEAAVSRLIGKTKIETVLSYDWTLDPYALGTWDYHKPMQSTKYWQALQENEGRIHFANSDNASGWRGFIDGAIERGKRVANDVIQVQAKA